MSEKAVREVVAEDRELGEEIPKLVMDALHQLINQMLLAPEDGTAIRARVQARSLLDGFAIGKGVADEQGNYRFDLETGRVHPPGEKEDATPLQEEASSQEDS
tara:strand:- start:193 stop:501 length:309 start_codon:yes stop_codon:yes gene_type:complete